MKIYLIHIFYVITCLINSANGQTKSELKFHHLNVEKGLPQNSVYSIVTDKYGFMWFGTWGGAVRYDGYTFKVYHPHENDSTSLPSYRIRCMVQDSIKNIWIETENSNFLYRYEYEIDNFTRHPWNRIPKYLQQKIAQWHSHEFKEVQNKEYLFSISNNGLIQTNLLTGKQHRYKVERTNPFALSDNSLKNVYLDEQKTLWIGTQNGGVNYTSLYANPFYNVYANENGDGLISNGVRAICTDKTGCIYVGSENRGITILDTSNSPYTYSFLGEDELPNLQIRALHCDPNGIVWIGTKAGLYSFNPEIRESIKAIKDSTNVQVFSLYTDHNHDLWVGTMRGLARYDDDNKRLNYLPDNQKPTGVYIRSIIEDNQNNIWVATEDFGVSRLSRKIVNGVETFIPIKYRKIEGDKNSLLSDRTYSLTQDDQGFIWIATGFGLSRLDPETNAFKNFTVDDELPDNRIMSVLYDGNNSVWVSHNRGLTRINTGSLSMQHFDVNDGLQGNEFIQSSSYYDALKDICYFGGTNGLSYFHSNQIAINPYPPRIAFTNLFVNYKKVKPGDEINKRVMLKKSLLCTNNIILSWHDRNLRIEFSALHYANPTGNQYKYKLEGYDKDWVLTDATLRSASYSNLKAGTYTFKVLAANSDGVWTKAPKSMIIQVLPPWWLTRWAITIYILAFILMVIFVYRIVTTRIKARQTEALHVAKARFFTEMSHEFRTPLTLIIDPLNKLITEKTDSETAQKYYSLMQRNARQLLHLINQLLDFRKLESGSMRLSASQHDLILFAKNMVAAFEQMADDKDITLYLKTNTDALPMLFDEQKLNMVMNNLLSNAIKFTPERGEINIIIIEDIENEQVIIEVADNGIGIEKREQEKIFEAFYQTNNNTSSHKGTGIGLALTKELIQLHQGSIKVNSEAGKGTCFSICLPINTRNGHVDISVSSIKEEIVVERSYNGVEEKTNNTADLPLLLVVDDNADIREYIRINLEKNYRLMLATNGAEGLEIAFEHIPDIIISDVMMPKINGIEFCNQLKNDRRTSHIPIVLLTARQSDEAKTEGYQTGADAYLTKPFTTHMLQVRLQNLLEQRQKLRDRFSSTPATQWKNIAENTADQEFLDKVQNLVEQHLDNPEFSIDQLSLEAGMSRSQFYRKIKALTNKSGNEFITSFRMNKASEYLLNGKFNITETAYKIGYSAPNSFTRAFLKHFGVSPTQYIENNKA